MACAQTIDRTFFAMGSPGRIVATVVDADAIDDALEELERLEQCWSRFRASSELNEIGRGEGYRGPVSSRLRGVLIAAQQLWRATDGLFDPTIRERLEALGYDRPFGQITGSELRTDNCDSVARRVDGRTVHAGFDEVQLGDGRQVVVPCGVTLDVGGIGKGLAADLLAARLVAGGVTRVIVSLGGDVRCAGASEVDATWQVPVEDPCRPDHILFEHSCRGTAIVTTTTRYRRWMHNGDEVHHVIDPRLGTPAQNGVLAVVATAPTAWWAEGIAKAALVAGPDAAVDVLERCGVGGWVFLEDGRIRQTLDVAAIAGHRWVPCS